MNAELAQAQAILNGSKPNPDKALKVLSPLLKRQNKPWMLYHFLGVANLQKKNYEKAIQYLVKAVEKGSTEPETVHLMSMGYKELGNYEQAIHYAYKALHKNEKFVQAWMNLGAVYRAMADLDNALKAYQRANQLDKKNPAIAFRLAAIYTDQGDHVKGQKLYEITIKMDPEYIEAYLGLAQIQQRLFRFEEAVETIKKALKYDPKSLITRVELATAYKSMGDYDEAIQINKELIDEYPKLGLLRVNYALCFQEIGRFNEAEENYRKAFEVDSSISESISNYLMAIHYNPERTKQEIFDAHLLWDQHFAPKERPQRPIPTNLDPNKKLRVGILSGGFRKHPVGWMIVRAIENLPDDQIEIYGYTTHSLYDSITAKIQKKSAKWTPVIGYNDEVVANIIREDEIDILVELSGHASLNRLKTVALEPAPITVKWVGGLFNTTGMKSMDYLLTDNHESPAGEEEFYTEKLVRMPDDYIVYQIPTYGGIEVDELPAKKNGFITFGCFNNPTKINSELLEQWASILHEVPDSKLFLKSKQYDTDSFVQNIVQVMEGFGIPKERLIFEGQSLHDALLKSYNRIDVALDPWPYSGGLTTCEALWMGVPVVTNSGPTFAGRHSTTHLINAGYPEWVTDNWEDYKAVVLDLVSDLDRLEEIRSTLRNNVLDSPLCDGKRFAAHLTVAFREMWKQRVNGYENNLAEGEWQDHIDVPMLSESAMEQMGANCEYSIEQRNVAESEVLENTFVRNKQGQQLSLPANANSLSTYIYKQSSSWLDGEIDFASSFLAKGMTAIDVGASYGAYSIPMAEKVGFQGKVFAIEPSLEMVSHLRESANANDYTQLELVQKAIGLDLGFVSYKQESNPEFSRMDSQGKDSVECIALDEFWVELDRPNIDLLKIDVNGDELEVIESAQALISFEKPILIVSRMPGHDDQLDVQNVIVRLGYQLFEFISGMGVLAPFGGYFSDSNVTNLIAVHSEHVRSERISEWIFKDSNDVEPVDPNSWKQIVQNQEWINQLPVDWSTESFSDVSPEYLEALNLLVSAEEIQRETSTSTRQNNQKATEWMLSAAGMLVDLHSNGNQSIPVQLTLSRVLLNLGKRDDAVSLLKNVIDKLLPGVESVSFTIPFVLPIKAQDSSGITRDPIAWLKVKVLEAWLLLKEQSTYFSDEKDVNYLKGLSGNPDSLPVIDKIVKELLPEKNIQAKQGGKFIHIVFNHVYAKSLVDLIDYTNERSDQEHICYVEYHRAIKTYQIDLEDSPSSIYFNCLKHLPLLVKRCLQEDVDGVIFHGIFLEYQKELIRQIGDRKHIGWVLWGGDLYRPIQDGNPIHDVAEHVDSIYSIVEGDFEVFKEVYGDRPAFKFSYPYPGLYGDSLLNKDVQKTNTIIVGNSGDPSNNHIDLIRQLAAKKDIHEYSLILPVSYNFLPEYEEILLKEIEKLGLEDIVQLKKDFISPAQYFKLIASSKLVLMAHNRQQAVGNVLMALYSGTNVFLPEQIKVADETKANPTWNFLYENGLQPSSLNDFKDAKRISDLPEVEESLIEAQREIIDSNFGMKQRFNELESFSKTIKNMEKHYA